MDDERDEFTKGWDAAGRIERERCERQVRAAFMAGYLAAGCAYCTPNEGREPAAEQAYERWREDRDG